MRLPRRVRELLHDVTPGFRVLVDFRWLESMDSAAAPHLAKMMETLTEKGVASVDAGGDRSAQGHWCEYSFPIPLRTGDPNHNLRDVSRRSTDSRRESKFSVYVRVCSRRVLAFIWATARSQISAPTLEPRMSPALPSARWT